MKESDPQTKPTFLQLLGSVLAAIGGVQSKENLHRDFNSNSAWKIAGIGIAVTIIFVLLIVFGARYAAS